MRAPARISAGAGNCCNRSSCGRRKLRRPQEELVDPCGRKDGLLLLCERGRVDLVEHVLGLGEGRAQLVEEVAREALVAGGAGIKAAQRGAAQLGVLLGREALGEGGVLVPEVLVVLGAVGRARSLHRRGGAQGGKSENGNSETLHIEISISSAAMEPPSLAAYRYDTAPSRFQSPAK